ncbi:alpha/beta hydrolase [Beauveria bassiana ARSEF 2860]|uniref:Alpha/beta hydrolase n=1 Tax=Beauveria bassiana (strain ARSEF 2860) TaxID=655819 RepID=J4KKX2_BEAB2|nr:alpha/beta hydrolase [Beauveria bassiana ARSEF 2860]EJP61199.1 alpha/beta hydrolase [Beauveria bassiana ARSEF 2860]
MYTFFKSQFFHFEFLRVIGTAPFEGCDIGECLEALASIRNNDAEGWFRAWVDIGAKAEKVAVDADRRGDREASRWAWIRSGNYLRAAEYMLHCTPKDPRLLKTLEHSVSNFQRGFQLLEDPNGRGGEVLHLEIPYNGDMMLPAYLFMPLREADSKGPVPVIVNSGGFDSTQEELYFYVAAGARRRGYAVLTFDGPGQGIFLRQQDQKRGFPATARPGTYMRHDWEVVISKILDGLFSYAAESPQLHLDLERISIFGESMGAYFALRGSADPRIKACIAMDGFYDMWDIADSRIPPVFLKAWDTMGDGFFNRVVRSLGKVDFRTRFEFTHARFALGLPDFAQSTREFKRFTLRSEDGSEYLRHVKCPVFVTGAADWAYFPAKGNATKIHAVMEQLHPGKSKLWIAKGVGSGGLQAKVAAISVVHDKTFEWLGQVLAQA